MSPPPPPLYFYYFITIFIKAFITSEMTTFDTKLIILRQRLVTEILHKRISIKVIQYKILFCPIRRTEIAIDL